MGSLAAWIMKRDRRRLDSLAAAGEVSDSTPTGLAVTRLMAAAITTYAQGTLLDVGAGRCPYRHLMTGVAKYITLDVTPERAPHHILGDAQMLPVRNAAIDTALCTQVLEHVANPGTAVQEIARVLAVGGVAILSAPHLTHLHNEPYDFFRFTRYGLRVLIEGAGMEIIRLEPAGGLISFIGFILTVAVQSLTFTIPVVGRIVRASCRLFSRACVWLDSATGLVRLYPANYVVVAKKASR